MTAIEDQARSIFLAALESAPDQWPAFLKEACGEKAELRARVGQLLQAHQAMGSIHGGGADGPAVTTDEPFREHPGAVVGPYKLLEQIGEGGFGVVFMAAQTQPVRRKVALKVLKPGMDTRQVVARFEAERQALAIMDHPNIAKVFDGGATASGRPYFVMELVKGVPITRYCDDNQLTPRQRLELFVPVCQAVQHAHQKGIIHRDLKPSNVLVSRHDTTPIVKVIDFGVAKALGQALTDKTLFTGIAQMIGTPLYMSPEQAGMSDLDIDTRSDIYSLGVLLYELLTGTTPFDKKRFKQAAYDEIRRIIREEEPPKPSTRLSESKETLLSISAQRQTEPAKLSKLVRGELDWIVMKALEKDRNRRYETANGFAMDVQRYLGDEPVQACPPSVGYRFRKFARRNKRALATMALLALAVMVVAGTLGWAARDRESREQELARKAERDLALSEQGVGQALMQANKIRGELHAVLTKPGGVQELLNQPGRWGFLIQSAQSELGQARRSAARAGESLGAEFIQALHKLEEQLTGDEADRLLALRLEKIRLNRSIWVEGRFDHRKAVAEYSQAFAGYALLKEDAAAVAARLRSSPIKEQLVAALDDWALVALSLRNEPLAEQLLAVARQAAPDPAWADRLRQVKGWRDQDALGKLVEEAPAARLSPQMLYVVGGMYSQKGSIRASWLRRAQFQYPADFWLNFGLARALEKSDPVEAIGFYRVALAVRPTSIATYNNLGNALRDQKKLPEAVAAFRKAIEIDPRFVYAYSNLGNALLDQKKLPEAVSAYHKAIEIDPKFASAYNNLGNVLAQQSKLDQAIEAYSMALTLKPADARPRNSRGRAYAALGQWKKAACDLAPSTATGAASEFWGQVACLRLLLGDTKAYQQMCKQASEHVERTKKDAYETVRICTLAADGPVAAPRLVSWAEQAVAVEKSAWRLHMLARAHYRAGQFDQAERCCRQSLELEPNWPGRILNWLVLAMAHQRLGHPDEARTWLAKAVQWRATLASGGDKVVATCPPGLGLPDWLEFHVLLPEAQTLGPGTVEKK